MEDEASERARIEALLKALEETAGSISAEDNPEWATSEMVAAWVRKLRWHPDEPPDRGQGQG